MKRRGMVLTACWLALALSPIVSEGDENDKFLRSLMIMGKQYFEQYCSSCHGMDGRGNGPVASALRTPPADLTRIAKRRDGKFPEAEIAMYIDGRADVRAHGSRDMPVWGRRFGDKFGDDAISEEFVRGHLLILIEFLKSIQQ